MHTLNRLLNIKNYIHNYILFISSDIITYNHLFYI